MAQTVKKLSAKQETRVWPSGEEDPLAKGMATHSSILAWKIPWTLEPGGLQSMRSQWIGRDWAANTFTSLQTLYTPATHSSILAWKFHEQRSLTGYSLWGHKESDMAEHTHKHYINAWLVGRWLGRLCRQTDRHRRKQLPSRLLTWQVSHKTEDN